MILVGNLVDYTISLNYFPFCTTTSHSEGSKVIKCEVLGVITHLIVIMFPLCQVMEDMPSQLGINVSWHSSINIVVRIMRELKSFLFIMLSRGFVLTSLCHVVW